ncbi:phage tail tube protein [Pararhodospirillum photometricum]|nr:phage tail tube protein [Pararhodospirillum photometricum]
MATTGYFAAQDTNNLTIGLARETTWGTPPTGTYEGMRVQSFGLGENTNRTRPNEIRPDMQASAAVTQDVQSSGGLQFAISYGNQDLVWPTLFTGDWTNDLAISDTDIAADATAKTFSGAAGTFSAVALGQWVKVSGFSAAGANGYFRVTAKASDGASITVDPAPATDAGGEAVTVSGSLLVNSTVVNTLSIQERYSTTHGFIYSGCIASGGQINAARGQFFSGTIDLIAKSEEKAASAVGTMGAAPTNRVFNTVGNMRAIALGSLTGAKVDSLTTTIAREGAAANFALGDPGAIGVTLGTFTVSGQIKLYFSDYSAYDLYKSEAAIRTSYQVTDKAGNSYIVELPEIVLGKVTRERGGPNQPVMATFEWMADPHPTLGWTMGINRFPAA